MCTQEEYNRGRDEEREDWLDLITNRFYRSASRAERNVLCSLLEVFLGKNGYEDEGYIKDTTISPSSLINLCTNLGGIADGSIKCFSINKDGDFVHEHIHLWMDNKAVMLSIVDNTIMCRKETHAVVAINKEVYYGLKKSSAVAKIDKMKNEKKKLRKIRKSFNKKIGITFYFDADVPPKIFYFNSLPNFDHLDEQTVYLIEE